ncbi:unnamed protein product, partial [Oikopleura dioica]
MFVKELKSTSAMLGTSFTFSSTTNFPDLEAVWYLNGDKIPIYKTMAEYNRADQREKFPFVAMKSKGNNHSLQCGEAIERFAGRYTVEVTNEEGETVKSDADLKVLYQPPVFLKDLEDIHVDEGKKVSFVCRIDDPNQEVVWYFRDSSDRVTFVNPRDAASSFTVCDDGKGAHSLRLTAKKFLEGEISCRMDFGKSTGSQRDLLISTSAPPPKFDMKLKDLVKNRRDRVEFGCTVSDPDAPVIWFKGERELRPAAEYDFLAKGRDRKLVIKNATFDDAGRYSCEMGEEKTSATLKVNEMELKVVKSLGNIECPLDGDAVFETILNSSNAEPVWKKDGIPLRESDDVEMLEEEVEGGVRYRLILRKQTVDDSGEISFCALGNQAKQKASLTVKDLPLGFSLKMSDQKVKAGESARFEINVTRRDAVAKWSVDGKPVQNSGKFRVTSRGFTRKLTVEDCDGVKDNYIVVCTIEESGENASTMATLTTTFANELSDAEFPINQTAEIVCDVNFPELVVVWDKDGEEINDGGKYKMGTDGDYRRSLAIADASEQDSGVYTATLKDGTKSSANVKVVAAPSITYTPPAVYRGTIEGYELDNSWKKLENTDRLAVIANGVNRKIEIRDVKASDAGEYCCATPDAKTFGRICVEAFKFVRALEDTEVGEKESAEFFVEISKPSRKVTWTLNGTKITSGGDTVLRNEGKILTCIMDNTSMDMVGTIAVEVEHIRCEAQLSVTKDVKFTSKLEDKFAQEKEDVVYEVSVSTVDAEVTWSADNEPITAVEGKFTIQKDGRKRRLTVHNINVPVKWYKNKEEIKAGPKFEMSADGLKRTLTISDVGYNDESNYSCKAEDAKTTAALTVQTIAVEFVNSLSDLEVTEVNQAALRFTKSLEDMEAENKMASVEFTCELSRANANVQWFVNGAEIFPSRKFGMAIDGTKRSLVVHDISYDDAAEYTCDAGEVKSAAKLNVIPANIKFVTPLADSECFERESFSFEAEITHVNMEGKWFFNGEEISASKKIEMSVQGTAHILTINDASQEDAGDYKFVIEGVETAAKLAVNEIPAKFVKRLQDEASTEKEECILSCEVNRPNAEVVWKLNGEPVTAGDRYEIVADGRRRALVIKSVVQEDEGKWTCDATDDETTCELVVGGRDIRITKKMMDLEVIEGEKASFELQISHEDVETQWLINGEVQTVCDNVDIQVDGRRHVIIIEQADLKMSGLIVFQTDGAKQEARFDVVEAPCTFTAPINDITVLENENGVFECKVSKGGAEVTWYKGRTKLHLSDKYEMVAKDLLRSLIVKNASFDDESQFSAQVGDSKCAAKLSITTMQVNILEKFDDQTKTDTVVIERDTAEFEIEISHADIPATWILKKGDEEEELVASKSVELGSFRTVHKLKLYNCELSQSGELIFKAGNLTTSCKFDVKEPGARFTKRLADQSATEADSAVFECEISRPNADVKWFHKDVEVEAGDKYQIEVSNRRRTLIVTGCSSADEGDVKCISEDDETIAQLQIEGRDIKILKKLSDMEVTEGEPASFELDVNYENVSGSWVVNGIAVENGDAFETSVRGKKHILKVRFAATEHTDDGGVISFNAEGIQGEASLSVCATPVDVLEELPKTVVKEGDEASVSVTVSDPRATGQWFINGVKLNRTDRIRLANDDGKHTLTIKNASRDEAGEVVFVCNNAKSTNEIIVKEPPVTFTRSMIDQSVTEASIVEFEIEINRLNGKVEWVDGQGAVIANEGRFEIVSEGRRRKLIIDNARLSDAGEITVRGVKDEEDDEVNSATAKLEVAARDVRIRRHLQDQQCYEGEQTDFTCDTSFADVSPHWTINGQLLTESDDVVFEQSGTRQRLLLKNVQLTQAGKVEFYGKTAASLTVLESPVDFTEEMDNLEVEEKTQAEFKCTLSRATAQVKWFKGRRLLKPGKKYEMIEDGPRRILRIPKVEFADEKDYSCACDDALVTAKLVVQPRNIVMVANLKDLSVSEGETAVFECELSHSEVEAIWYRDGNRIIKSAQVQMETDGNIARLTIKNTSEDEDNNSEIQCRAEDALSSAMLMVKGLPLNIVEPLNDKYAFAMGAKAT